jgi:hypothetical protein
MKPDRAPAPGALLDLGQQERADATPLTTAVDEQSPQAVAGWIDLGDANQAPRLLGHDGFGRPQRVDVQRLRIAGKDSRTLRGIVVSAAVVLNRSLDQTQDGGDLLETDRSRRKAQRQGSGVGHVCFALHTAHSDTGCRIVTIVRRSGTFMVTALAAGPADQPVATAAFSAPGDRRRAARESLRASDGPLSCSLVSLRRGEVDPAPGCVVETHAKGNAG